MNRSSDSTAAAPAAPGLTRTLVGTPLLALLSLAGNYFNLTLFFGVEVLFGSVAVLLALVWLGTWPGLLVALVGGAYTWFLWDHPYALLILLAEAASVAWHRGYARRRGREAPPLAVSVTLYWLLLGIPLVGLCYHWGLGMGWLPTLLVALKQALSGILNAALAGLVLLTTAALNQRRAALPVAPVLFSVLLACVLLPSLLITAWQSRDLKGHLEVELAERLSLFARFAVHDLEPGPRPQARGAADLDAEIRHLTQILSESLPAGSDPQVRRSAPPGPGGGPPPTDVAPGRLPQRATGLPIGSAGLTIILPDGRPTSRMVRWRQARYRLEIPTGLTPASLTPTGERLTVEISAAPLIEQLQQTLTQLLLALLALACLGVALAQALSRQFVRPLQRLVAVTAALPAAIREDRPWPLPRPGLLREPVQLADAVAAMAGSLTASFRALAQEKDEQVRQRSLLDLQAQSLAWLVTGEDDEGAFADRLCRQVETLLPGHHCTLVQPAPQGGLEVLAAPGLRAPERAQINQLLARPQALCCYTQVLDTGAPAEILDTLTDDRCADLPAAARQWLRAGFALPIVGRAPGVMGVLSLGSPNPGRADPFARDLMEAAATLAGLALDSIRLRQRLRRSEARLAESQRIADMGSWYQDTRSQEVEWSDQGYRLLGYEPGTVTPTLGNFLRRIHPADRGLITGQLRAVLAGATLTDEHDVRVRRPDGSERILHYRTRVQRDPQGQVSALEGVSIDITERKAAELALSGERRRLSNIIAATRVGTWEWLVQTGVTLVNERWAEIVGYRLDDLAPFTIQTWMDLTHPDDLKHSLDLAQAHFRGEVDGYECELRMRHRDGHWVWVLDQGRVMEWDAAGAPLLMSGIHQDITERKHAELALAQRESMVAELLALAAQFVGAPDQGLDDLTGEALARIGRFAQVDRSYLVRLDESAGTLTNTLEWTAPGIDAAQTHNQAIPIAAAPALMERLRLGEPVMIPRVADLPPDWSREQAICRAQGIQSLLIAPLAVGEVLLGLVSLDAVRAARDWSPVEVRFLQVFASIVAGAMDRARTTEDLRASNARYEQLARQSRSMSWEIDPTGRYTYVSPVCEQVLGYRADELIGTYFYDHLAGADREEVRTAALAIMERRDPIRDFDRLCLGVEDWRVWLMSNGAPMYAADGTYLGYRGIDTDITDRHLAQDLIRESEARLSAVFENAPIGMALIGSDRRLTLINRAVAAFLGRPPQDLTGVRFDDLSDPDDLERNLAQFADLQAGSSSGYRITKHYVRPDGSRVWGDVRVALLPTRPGAAPLPLAMVEDITELHEATERQRALEDALTRYAAQLEELVDLINRPLPPADQDSALLGLGCRTLGAAAAVFGLLDEEHGHQVLTAVPDAGADGPGPALLQAVLTQTLAHPGLPCVLGATQLPGSETGYRSCIGLAFEKRQADRPAETLILSFWGTEPTLALGEPERQLIRLIAQRMAAVRYQEQIQHDLVESRERETIGHLASGVAHDFNNLLGVIDANIYFLQSGLPGADTDPELRQVLEETQSALGQAKVITSGMLSLSRAGGVPLEPVDLEQTVVELVRILRQILPAAIRLRVEIPSGLKARTNAGFLQAALLNLALNARDAMPAGGDLHIEAAPLAWTGDTPLAVGTLSAMDCVALRVTDTGSGIAPALLPRIFEPLFSTKAKQRGHGLGLFMVQEFITRSGAGLTVESSPGGGTSFLLLLPAAAGPPRADLLPAPPRAGPAAGNGSQASPRAPRILVVDDDPRVREAVARLLTLDGLELGQAEHAQAALALLAQDPGFDLVLSDIAMPGLDGIGLYRHLARVRPELPVILMTGQDSALPVIDALGERPLVLRKPLDPPTLRAAIRARVGLGLCR